MATMTMPPDLKETPMPGTEFMTTAIKAVSG
jgi:hypothetical protein